MRRLFATFAASPGLILFAVVAIVFGGTKPTESARIRWDDGLHDVGSVATNDQLVIRGTVDAVYAADALHIDYRPKTSTNALDWVRLYDGKTSDLYAGIELYIRDCVKMEIYVWSEYVQPPSVHTNGEFRVDYLSRPFDLERPAVTNAAPKYLLLRTPVFDGAGRQMSPPELPSPKEEDE